MSQEKVDFFNFLSENSLYKMSQSDLSRGCICSHFQKQYVNIINLVTKFTFFRSFDFPFV